MMSLAQSTSLNLLAAEPGMKVWMGGSQRHPIRNNVLTATANGRRTAPASWLHETELCPYPDSNMPKRRRLIDRPVRCVSS